MCKCLKGFKMNDDGECVDFDKCANFSGKTVALMPIVTILIVDFIALVLQDSAATQLNYAKI